MNFGLFLSQSLFKDIIIENYLWPFYEYRLQLSRDGEVVPYIPQTRKN